MSIYEYDQEEHIRLEREDAYEDGRKEGITEGDRARLIQIIKKKLERGDSLEKIADDLVESVEAIEQMVRELNK